MNAKIYKHYTAQQLDQQKRRHRVARDRIRHPSELVLAGD